MPLPLLTYCAVRQRSIIRTFNGTKVNATHTRTSAWPIKQRSTVEKKAFTWYAYPISIAHMQIFFAPKADRECLLLLFSEGLYFFALFTLFLLWIDIVALCCHSVCYTRQCNNQNNETNFDRTPVNYICQIVQCSENTAHTNINSMFPIKLTV